MNKNALADTKREVVCHQDDLQPGQMLEYTFGRHPVVVCRAEDGRFFAFLNRCIHQGAPLSKGKLCGATAPTSNIGEYRFEKEGDILRCPWHGREFDIKNSGCMLAQPKYKLKSFKVTVEDEHVVIYR
ncbi:Rieske (2Fe-2S) protein [Caldalkalibacillus salinus]|uniref:Rieske (2Fe-2S) protein n=1 Tax=Caldalkalibacillus salinus TaxID=2803787 RepID=UPI0019220853|nr:Rieske (2Fe-2S) protein [Caldalkalibacillus salinus]